MTDWTPLTGSYSDDPVPGDPGGVARLRDHFSRISAAAGDSHTQMQNLNLSVEWTGAAADKFFQSLDTLRDVLPLLSDSFGSAAGALSHYEGSLTAAQNQALQALRKAEDAEHQIRQAQSGKHQAAAGVDTSAFDRLEKQGNELMRQAAALRRQSVQDRDDAAQTCIHAIQDAKNLGLQDSAWSHGERLANDIVHTVNEVVGFVDANLEKISDILGAISSFASLIALATCWIPVVGELFGTVALIASGAKLLVDLKLMSEKRGRMGLGDIASDFLGLGTGGLSKVGVFAGKALGSAKIVRIAEKFDLAGQAKVAQFGDARQASSSLGGISTAGGAVQNAPALSKEAWIGARLYGTAASSKYVPINPTAFGVLHPLQSMSAYFGARAIRAASSWWELPASVKFTGADFTEKVGSKVYTWALKPQPAGTGAR